MTDAEKFKRSRDLKIYKLIVGVIQSNCYVIETENKNAVIIDAGAEADRIFALLEEKGLTLKKILLTHGHFDHIGAVAEIVQKTGAEVYIYPADASKLQSEEKSLANVIPGQKFAKVTKYTPVNDGDVIVQDELSFRAIHTPGHTKGGVCYVCLDNIFSGDTLFAGTVGRTDFADGSLEDIKTSMKKLVALEGNYNIFCGHDKSTTLDEERKNNVYMRDL